MWRLLCLNTLIKNDVNLGDMFRNGLKSPEFVHTWIELKQTDDDGNLLSRDVISFNTKDSLTGDKQGIFDKEEYLEGRVAKEYTVTLTKEQYLVIC